MQVEDKYIVERDGKPFVLYAGLLALATGNGLRSIKTTVLQLPSPANGEMAVVQATVYLVRDGEKREFDGTASASPSDLSAIGAMFPVSSCETRAKARALRDALNIDMCSFEELQQENVITPLPLGNPSAPRPSNGAASVEPAISRAQIAMIVKFSGQVGLDVPDTAGWTSAQAIAHISFLRKSMVTP